MTSLTHTFSSFMIHISNYYFSATRLWICWLSWSEWYRLASPCMMVMWRKTPSAAMDTATALSSVLIGVSFPVSGLEHCFLIGTRLHLRSVQSFRATSLLLQNVFCRETLPQNSSNTTTEFQCRRIEDFQRNSPRIMNITWLCSVSCKCFSEWNCIIIIRQGETVPSKSRQLST